MLLRTRRDRERGLRVRLVPWFTIIGALLCIHLMTKLDAVTWLRFFGRLVAGPIIHAMYGRTDPRLQRGGPDVARADVAV